MPFFHLECWVYWISATSYFLDKVIVAFCLTMSDSEPVQLVEKKNNLQKTVHWKMHFKGGVVAEDQSL